MVTWNSALGGFVYIWQGKRVGIIAVKTKRTQIHFSSDVLVAVASWILKSLMIMIMTMMIMTMMTKMKMVEKDVIICIRIASDFIHNQFSVFKVLPVFGVFIKKQTSIKLVLTLPTIHRWKKSRPPRLEILISQSYENYSIEHPQIWPRRVRAVE